MNSNPRQERVNLILSALNSLTVEEFLKVAQVEGLKPSRGKWRGRCPIHGGDSKAFTVYQKSSGTFYNCPTSCGSGNNVKLFAKLNNLDTKGRDFITAINLIAQRMGIPGVEGGELTEAQKAAIEKRKAEAEERRKERLEQEQEEERLTNAVLLALMARLDVSEAVVSYLHGRGLVENSEQARAVGVRSWDPVAVSGLLGQFSTEELRTVFGKGEELMKQFNPRPLLMFAFAGEQCVGVQCRSIDPQCEKVWRYNSRGKVALGFFGGEQLSLNVTAPVVIVEGMTDTVIGRRLPEFASEWFDGETPIIVGKPGSGTINRRCARLLQGRDVALVFDGDKAGVKGVQTSAQVLTEYAKRVRHINLDGDLAEALAKVLS